MTTALSISKQQRLRTLEKNIRDEAAKIQSSGLAIGQYLMEIRDDHLWKDDFESWNQYLKERAGELVGKSFLQAARLISAAEIAKRLPSSFIDETTVTATHLSELGRLAPNSGKNTSGGGCEKDYSRLRKGDVERVWKAASKKSGNDSPSVREVRKAVDADLGIDRAAKAKETRGKDGVDLIDYVETQITAIDRCRRNLKDIKRDSWKLFNADNPSSVKRLISACQSLIDVLKEVKL
jgi:hypothetical protein